MNKPGRILRILFGILMVSLAYRRDSWGKTVFLTPKAGFTVYSSKVHVVVVSTNTIKAVKLENFREGELESYQEIKPIKVARNGKFSVYHFEVTLLPGKNTIRAIPTKINIAISYHPSTPGAEPITSHQVRYLFHTKARETPCTRCHKNESEKQRERSCKTCHSDTTGSPGMWIHGPAANWECISCHNPAYDKNGVRYQPFFGGDYRLCISCHISKRVWLDMHHIHGPVGTGRCTVCHNPHAGRFKFQLRAEGKEGICLICHTVKKKELSEKGMRVHAILEAEGCVICHSPHASNHRYQLYKGVVNLCTSCHPKYKDMKRGHPVEGHPLHGGKDPIHPQRSFTCASCHDPHGSFYDCLLIGAPGSSLCFKCHKLK